MGTHPPFSEEPGIRRLMVFGHPAHELALFGAVQRLKPEIVVVTDGGGPEREEYSRRALAEIGRLEATRYLGYHESDFYRALLEADAGYFEEVVDRLRAELERVRPQQVFCDAIEYYNPVHDITLVLLRAAMAGGDQPDVFRVPLVYQLAGGEGYRIQRVPEELADRRVVLELTDAEVARKRRARNEIYLNLHDQAGGDFLGVTDSEMRREEVEVSGDLEFSPGADGRRMRYEWRAELLQREGVVDHKITFSDHFLPMVEHLLGS